MGRGGGGLVELDCRACGPVEAGDELPGTDQGGQRVGRVVSGHGRHGLTLGDLPFGAGTLRHMETGWSTAAADTSHDATAGCATDAPDAAGGDEEAQRLSIDAVDVLLDEVEQALARLEDGTYGRCERCGEPIGDERLAELAIIRTCAACFTEPDEAD